MSVHLCGKLCRLPITGCFAAALRIFEELRIRLPSLKPKRMLDFGSGMGTAIWAAHQV